MSKFLSELKFEPNAKCKEIETFIHEKLDFFQRDGAILGLSGGLDSAVAAALTIRSLGAERVILINMPEKDSKKIHRKHAKLLAQQFGSKLIEMPISNLLKAANTYKLLPISLIPSQKLRGSVVKFTKSKLLSLSEEEILSRRLQPDAKSWVAKGNAYSVAKHRMRMVLIYQYAEVNNLMVVGAANKTELLTGTFSKWGIDHCADIMPLLHIYRSQLEELAEYLEIPEEIRYKPADPDIMPGVDDKGKLLGEIPIIDQILYALENELSLTEFIKRHGDRVVNTILTLYQKSKHMRESPYHL